MINMKKRDTMTLKEKIEMIQKTVPTFTQEKAMECTAKELEDLLDKVVAYTMAKWDLEMMIKTQKY